MSRSEAEILVATFDAERFGRYYIEDGGGDRLVSLFYEFCLEEFVPSNHMLRDRSVR
jgi:hypothetical protein